MTNENKDPLIACLEKVSKQDWQASEIDGTPVYTAQTQRFYADVITGAINEMAESAGAKGKAYSQPTGNSERILGNDPQAPRQVVVPRSLIENAELQAEMEKHDTTRTASRAASVISSSSHLGFSSP
ncbi:MAG: hypothetical protein MK052_03625 [Alphaproteobacteria bacterium]|nr:hypothetical protein [Alphaproteobacteria bacterium]